MKNFVWIIIAVILCGMSPAHSQSTDSPANAFSVGITGGLNFADMHFPNHQSDEDQRISSLLAFGGGAVLDIRLAKNLYVRIEPMYLQKGGNIEEGRDLANQPGGQLTSSSIEIPLLIQYAFGDRIQPYFVGGPTVGYNLKSDIEFDLTGLKFKGDLKDVIGTFDLGVTFGVGLQLRADFGTVFLEGRYVYGLLNQRKSGTVTVKSNGFQFDLDTEKERDKYTNRGFLLLTGVLLPL